MREGREEIQTRFIFIKQIIFFFSRGYSARKMTRADTGSPFDLIAEETEGEEDEWTEEMRQKLEQDSACWQLPAA